MIIKAKNKQEEDQQCQDDQIILSVGRRTKAIVPISIISAICILFIVFLGIKEYTYQTAILDFEKGQYNKSIKIFAKLVDYKDAGEYLKKAVLNRKYAEFNVNIDIEPEIFEQIGAKTPEEVEEGMAAGIYGEWYNMENNEKIEVSYDKINNRPYGVKYATCAGGSIVVYFYFLDDPQKIHIVTKHYEEFYYIEKFVGVLSISQTDSGYGEEYTFCSIPMEEYNVLAEQNAQIAAQQPAYSDDEVIQKAFSAFKSKIGGRYSGAGKLYHAANYSDAFVTYNMKLKTYTCTFTGEYSTNAFDFWGTSTQTYFVSAEYLDTGVELVLLSFNIN